MNAPERQHLGQKPGSAWTINLNLHNTISERFVNRKSGQPDIATSYDKTVPWWQNKDSTSFVALMAVSPTGTIRTKRVRI